jgi:hypothetical protein
MSAGSVALFVPAMLLASVSLSGAQQPPPLPRPAIAKPPPAPAALSVPDPFAGTRQGPRDLYQLPDGSDRFQQLPQHPAQLPVFPPGFYYPGAYYPYGYAYGYPYYETSMAETYRMSMAETYLRRQRETARGSLVLEAVLPTAQVFVDGHYAGLAEGFGPGRGAMNLNAGAHHIELRAPGYDTLTFSVMIEPNGLVRYRGDMQRIPTTPAPAATPSQPAPAAAKSFYVIPNCYAGDKPPSGALPKGCDIKKLQTRK